MAGTQGMTIADAAERTGLTPDTLRYYEKDGLMLRPVARGTTGHRRYSDADLVRQGDGNEQERLDLLRAHRVRVLAQLAEVQEHLGAIDRKIGIYTEKLAGLDLERTPSA